MSFWILAAALALIVAAVIAVALLRGRSGSEPAAAYDLRVYRDQLKEVDRDLARGLIGEADAERIRAEVSRRILAADAALQRERETGQSGKPMLNALAAVAALAVLTGGSLYIYTQIGAPGFGDLPLAARMEMAETLRGDRPAQSDAEARLPATPNPNLSPDFVALMERLRATVATRPDDLQGHILLARNEAASGNFTAAWQAQTRVIEIKGEAVEAADFADLADMMILAAGGYVSPEAEAALEQALARDPGNGVARYYWGLMMGQTGRPDIAFRVWDQLLRESAPQDGWVEPIRLQIEEMAMRAGVAYDLPALSDTAPRGPTAADVEAAGEMTPEERLDMIGAMVEGLADRLATEGGPPQDWARLITSLSVLGRTGEARAIYVNAQEAFADSPGALDILYRAAEQAGVGG
jgi:cytochrome c-type biogenesis protein CcmH